MPSKLRLPERSAASLLSPINTRKRKSFCNTIIINILQPIEKEPSAGKFNKKNKQKDKSFCCKCLNINKNSFPSFSNINRNGYPQPNRSHLPVIKESYGYFTHALFPIAAADIDQIPRISLLDLRQIL